MIHGLDFHHPPPHLALSSFPDLFTFWCSRPKTTIIFPSQINCCGSKLIISVCVRMLLINVLTPSVPSNMALGITWVPWYIQVFGYMQNKIFICNDPFRITAESLFAQMFICSDIGLDIFLCTILF